MKPILILIPALFFSSCAMNRGTRPDGSKYMSMSVLENVQDQERVITPDSFHERKIGTDQTTGGKIVGNTILGAIAVAKISDAVSNVVTARNATKTAQVVAGTNKAQIDANAAIEAQKLSNELEAMKLEAAAAEAAAP